jgi:predicted dehydrogenase
MNVGIIGCGRIADAHAEQIRRTPGNRLVGVCDREELMARQLCERFEAQAYYSDVDQLLEQARPQVVHITTPPQSHFALAARCLEAGCHVYVEKPLTVTAGEAETLISLARSKQLLLTVGHDDQYSHVARDMRQLVAAGYLGGPPIHMESHYGYDLGDQVYVRSLLGDKRHWIRSLPGTLMHNNISHGISRIAEYMPAENPNVTVQGFVSPLLRSMGETDIVDEVRAIISDETTGTTAYFTFSTQMRPVMRQFRLYGKANGLLLDHHHQTLIRIKGHRYKSYLEQFLPQYGFAKQYLAGSATNVVRFLRRDLHMKGGLKYLIDSFYQAITTHGDPPIPYREIVLTSRIMDSIFSQLQNSRSGARG